MLTAFPTLQSPMPIDTNRAIAAVAFQIAVCLTLRFVLGFKASAEALQEMSFLALTIPAWFLIRHRLSDFRMFRKTLSVALPYLFSVSLSFLFNLDNYDSDILFNIVTLGNLFYMFVLASLFASCRHNDLWPEILRYLAILACPVFVYVILTQQHAYQWGRWEPAGGHPNWWGMMGLGLTWAALAWKKPLVRLLVLAVAFYFMLKTQSRGSLVAFLPALFFGSGYFVPLSGKKILLLTSLLIAATIAVIVVSSVTSHDLAGTIADYLANDVMKINDPNRGLGTGMTGRTEAYSHAWDAFLESPVFGAGYSEFEGVHNGFLLSLAESGLFAFLGMVALFIVSLWGYIKARHWQGFGFVLSYMVLLLTFPRTFNINMTSLLFVLILMRGIRMLFVEKPVLFFRLPGFGKPRVAL